MICLASQCIVKEEEMYTGHLEENVSVMEHLLRSYAIYLWEAWT